MKTAYISDVIMCPDFLNESIEIKGEFDPEEDSFEPREAIVIKNGRTMDMFNVFEYAGIIDMLVEKTDWRLIYRNQFSIRIKL